MTIHAISLAGLLLGLVGSGILATSLNPLLKILSLSHDAAEITTQLLARGGDTPVFTGLDSHRAKAARRASRATRAGFWLLVISFALQALALILEL